MRRLRLTFLLALLAVAGAGAFALERSWTLEAALAGRTSRESDLEKAARLADRHGRAFGFARAAPQDAGMKSLVHETAAYRGVTIGYLSESERDAEKGRREKRVLVRLVEAPHPNVVFFLQDLEAKGGGARVRELHLRPSRTVPDAYEEAEAVLSKVVEAEGWKP